MAKNPNITSDAPSSDSKPEADKKPVHQDQTETDSREQLIVELRDAVRARDDFLAVVAHELRNPLTPILLCVQLIRETEQSEDEVKPSAEFDRLERLIKHFVARTTMLLEVAQISSNKFRLEAFRVEFVRSDRRRRQRVHADDSSQWLRVDYQYSEWSGRASR